MNTEELAQLSELIRNNDAEAVTRLRALSDYCHQTPDNETLFNIAIASDNRSVIELLADDKAALEFAPNIDPGIKRAVRMHVTHGFSTVEKTEAVLRNSHGPRICWQRTPLLQACRYRNREVIALLVSRGANVNARDIVDCTPAEICLDLGGTELLKFFIDCCLRAKKKVKISRLVMEKQVHDTAFYDWLIDNTELELDGKRLVFALACANLDLPRVEQLVKQGYNPSKLLHEFCNPVFEACTSSAAQAYKTEGYRDLAHLFVRLEPDKTVHYRDPLAAIEAARQRMKSPGVARERLDEHLKRRIALIDYLMAQGLSPDKVENCGAAVFGFAESVFLMGEPELVKILKKWGFPLWIQPDEREEAIELLSQYGAEHMIDVLLEHLTQASAPLPGHNFKAVMGSAVQWQLAGESVLNAATLPQQPKAGTSTCIRLTHINAYGPDDVTRFFIRCLAEDPESEPAWEALPLVEELLDTDGKLKRRPKSRKPVDEETVWFGTFEKAVVFQQPGSYRIEIRLQSEVEGMNGILPDWKIQVE